MRRTSKKTTRNIRGKIFKLMGTYFFYDYHKGNRVRYKEDDKIKLKGRLKC